MHRCCLTALSTISNFHFPLFYLLFQGHHSVVTFHKQVKICPSKNRSVQLLSHFAWLHIENMFRSCCNANECKYIHITSHSLNTFQVSETQFFLSSPWCSFPSPFWHFTTQKALSTCLADVLSKIKVNEISHRGQIVLNFLHNTEVCSGAVIKQSQVIIEVLQDWWPSHIQENAINETFNPSL